MANLRKLGHKILSEKYPDMESSFYSMGFIFGKIILKHRIRKGLTQAQLAEKAGFTPKTIHRVEGGHSNVTIDTYTTLFKLLDIDLNEIIEALNEKKAEMGKQNHLVESY